MPCYCVNWPKTQRVSFFEKEIWEHKCSVNVCFALEDVVDTLKMGIMAHSCLVKKMNAFLLLVRDICTGRSEICHWWGLQSTKKVSHQFLKTKLNDWKPPIRPEVGPLRRTKKVLSLTYQFELKLWPKRQELHDLSLHISDQYKLLRRCPKWFSTINAWNKTNIQTRSSVQVPAHNLTETTIVILLYT